MSKDNWKNDAIQFARLLAEIKAVGVTKSQRLALCKSMDISDQDLTELLDRADMAFEIIKEGAVL